MLTKVLKDILIFLLICFFAPSFAQSAPIDSASKLGHVTGAACGTSQECALGCKDSTGGQGFQSSCFAKTEGEKECPPSYLPPPGGLQCVCLKDVGRCGFEFPKKENLAKESIKKKSIDHKKSALSSPCAKLGEGLSPLGGGPPGSRGFLNQCCLGLKHVEAKEACGEAYGGYAGVCVACGDGTCDGRYENSCNCPVDCRIQ